MAKIVQNMFLAYKLPILRMLLIHVPEITERLQYIFDFYFSTLIRIPYGLTTDRKEYLNHGGAKFIYGDENFDEGIFFSSARLLFEKDIVRHNFTFAEWEGMRVFFTVNAGGLPFDPFAAGFYMISRYEEYLPGNRDRHNRFRASESLAYKENFLKKPVVNIWGNAIAEILVKNFPSLAVPERTFSFLPTLDIDNAFAYKYKGFLKTGGKLLLLLVSFRFSRFFKRLKVLCGLGQDPYDTYEKQSEIHQRYNLKPLYFLLLGDCSRYDRNLSHKNRAFRKLIRNLDRQAEVNLHPSYSSNQSLKQLMKEKERLEGILERKVTKSRQHYIKLNLPSTYRNLIRVGIEEDYSMGYPSRTGFRAGTSSPFLFFDLENNKKTDLKVHPFVAMDTSMKVYQKKRSAEVIEHLRPVVAEIRKHGGMFIFIFHNESLGNERNWKNWGEVYEKVIKLALKEEHAEVV